MEGTYQGIWNVPVRLSGSDFTDSYAVARLIFNIVFLILIFLVPIVPERFAWWINPPAHGVGNAFEGIYWGVLTLIMFVLGYPGS